jgi:hypothetical protein
MFTVQVETYRIENIRDVLQYDANLTETEIKSQLELKYSDKNYNYFIQPNFALIGDIHSQISKLERALDFCYVNNLCPIFLGDIFDSRCSTSDSVGVYRMIREAELKINAIVLQSNHQNKFIRWLKGNKILPNHGLERTIDDFLIGNYGEITTAHVEKEELLEWLENLPYGVIFRDKNLQEYRAAHAYFPSYAAKIVDNMKENLSKSTTCHKASYGGKAYLTFGESDFFDYEGVSPNNENPKVAKKSFRAIRDKMIYGPTKYLGTGENLRIPWWAEESTRNWVMCAGHYHAVNIDMDKKSIVVDGGCGSEGGHLCLYDVNNQQLHTF